MQKEGEKQKQLIITVHGIRTFGGWQERLENLVMNDKTTNDAEDTNPVFHNYKYNYFSLIGFLIPFLRWLVVRQFRKELIYHCKTEEWDRIDLVGHSFGTHLIAWGLWGIPEARRPEIHTIILSGSVLKSSFPWRDLVGKKVKRVVNDCGFKDSVLLINSLLVLFTGMAGRTGFSGSTHGYFRNRFFKFGHSGYFEDSNLEVCDEWMKKNWVSLLNSQGPVDAYDERPAPNILSGIWQSLVSVAEPIKLIIWASPFIILSLYLNHLLLDVKEKKAEVDELIRRVNVGYNKTEGLNSEKKICKEAIDVTATLASTSDIDEYRRKKVRFWELYYGEMNIVEIRQITKLKTGDIDSTMFSFGNHIVNTDAPDSRLQLYFLKSLATHLEKACADYFKKRQ